MSINLQAVRTVIGQPMLEEAHTAANLMTTAVTEHIMPNVHVGRRTGWLDGSVQQQPTANRLADGKSHQ